MALAALATVAAGPPAAPWTVFGLELGKPASIPQCQFKTLANGIKSQVVYEDDPAQVCVEPDIELRDAPWRRGAINFPLRQSPAFLWGNTGFTLVVAGKVEGLDLDTMGYAHSAAIIRELTAKFGRPTSVEKITATPSGIAVPAIEATWRFPNLHVRYESIGTDIQYGTILIETPVMQALRRAHARAQDAQRSKL